VDGYGVGSFISATKVKGMIAAVVSDERSAYMTREHNNSRMIALGSKIVGEELALSIVKEFLQATYAGGRHQVRVDMLNKMA
ncbi:RpiB/LacA/LacB family sugar-phosphate isomerase, partial [Enterococcus thailandicus]